MADNNIGMKAILTAFIALVLFFAFTTEIADNENANTVLSNRVNQSVTITSGSGNLGNTDVKGVSFFGNASNLSSTDYAAIQIGLHVNVSSNGTIQVAQNLNLSGVGDTNTSRIVFGNGNYNVSYTYGGSLYVNDSASRSLLSLTTLFWVLLGLAIGIIAFMSASGNMSFGFGKN